MSRRRVVITGMGWITPLGHDVEEVWAELLRGGSGVAPTTLFDARTFPSTFSAEIKDFRLENFLPPEQARAHADASRNTRFALAASVIAWRDALLDRNGPPDPTRVGVYLGGSEGPMDFDNFVEAAVRGWDHKARDLDACRWARVARERLDPVVELEQDPNMAAGHIAVLFNAQGPNFNTLTACAASTQAIGEATSIIRYGDADVVISGGTHSMVHPFGVTGFNRLTALSTRNDNCLQASRPFDRTRDGFVLGEGAGILILEELAHAKARGVKIMAEVTGFGSTADAFRITDIHEDGRGAIAAINLALKDAGLTPRDIDYVSAHGTSTEENDKVESLALSAVFGAEHPHVPVSSIKSMLGHVIAGAGAVELISCVLAIRDHKLPPTINYEHADPNCTLDYVPNEARDCKVQHALSNSFGFGGQNDTVIISRFEG